jgi:ferredoxin
VLGGEVVKLQITTACQGHGRCYTLAPHLLSSDDEGYVTIRGGDPIDVPDELIELAREVEGTCPESAISLLD